MLDFNKLLNASRITQTSERKGEGAPLLFLSDRGVGKTAKVQAYCDSINHLLITIILGRIPSVDVGGLKIPNFETKELDTFVSRKILGDVPSADQYDGICVFFDEVSATTEDQQSSIQSIIEDRNLEGNAVPDHVWFCFAGNTVDSNCGSNEIIRSLLDRVVVVEISDEDIAEEIFPAWLEWADGDGDIHPYITAFLRWSRSGGERNFFHDSNPQSSELAQPSARAWTKLSAFLSQELESDALNRIGKGLVGQGAYSEFRGFLKLGGELPTVEEVYATPDTARVPTGSCSISGLFAVISNVAGDLRSRRGTSLSTETVEAVITYVRRLDDAFAVFGFKQAAAAHPDFAKASKEYSQFLVDHKDLVV